MSAGKNGNENKPHRPTATPSFSYPLTLMTRETLVAATLEIEEASRRLRRILDRGWHTDNEVRDIRTQILRAVRNGVDPILGHMPDKRHY